MSATGFDVAAYCARIGYPGTPDAGRASLAALVAAHTRHIPFENLDPLLGVPVADLGPGALTAKLVARRRGGYCYEHNTLLRYALTEIGFDVDALGARVVWMNPDGLDGPPRAETHQALTVRIPGEEHRPLLVDVGFGGQTLTAPLPWILDEVHHTDHGAFRIRAHGAGFVLETLLRRVWQPMYTFTDQPRPLIDLEVGSWYVSTHPESKFVTGLSAALVTDDARWNLRGRHLAVHPVDGPTQRIRLDSAEQVCTTLTDRFGIDLTGLGDVEQRVAAVLDR